MGTRATDAECPKSQRMRRSINGRSIEQGSDQLTDCYRCVSQRCAYRNEQSLKEGGALVTGTQRISEDKIEVLKCPRDDCNPNG